MFSDIDTGKTQKVTKNHAGGGNERQDAYLYGNPAGRRRRYRSPAEFFPHLLWLATDEAGDQNNCSCKFCSPEELEADEIPPPPKASTTKPESIAKGITTAPVPARRPSQQNSQAIQTQAIEATPLPRHRTPEQRLDAQFNEFVYRPGEVVWFARGSAWGLGVIAQRDITYSFDNTRQFQYRVQPLSHPLRHPPSAVCTQNNLRPWLAWSPPPCTCAALNPSPSNQNKVLTYETVNWQAFSEGSYGQGDAEVDGSILAAKSTETTFTLFERIESKTSTSGSSQISEIYYNGIFIGAEKIWLGDPLRLRKHDSPTDIMILHAIIERPHMDSPSRSQVILIGDTYTLQATTLAQNAVPQNEVYLPSRVREDLRARNAITSINSDPSKRTSLWKLQGKAVRMSIADIKGRWYESSIFVPIMDPAAYENNRRVGEIMDAGLWMNGQGDCNRPPGGPLRSFKPADVKIRKREDAFGRSVPQTFSISVGVEDTKRGMSDGLREVRMGDRPHTPLQLPNRDSIQQKPAQTQFTHNEQMQQQSFANNDGAGAAPYVTAPPLVDGSFDQYMKFDDAEDDAGLPGFDQQYGSQDLDHGFFQHDAMQQ